MSECIPVEIARPDFWPKVAVCSRSSALIGSDGQLRLSSEREGYVGWEVIQAGQQWRMVSVEAENIRFKAIRADGTLWWWGYDEEDNISEYPVQIGADTNWLRVYSAYDGRTLALKENGTLWAWGQGLYGQLGLGDTAFRLTPTQVGTDTDWVWIGGPNYTSYAAKQDGSLWAWGSNLLGRVLGDSGAVDQVLTPVQVAGAAP